jgi:hypothetical protein
LAKKPEVKNLVTLSLQVTKKLASGFHNTGFVSDEQGKNHGGDCGDTLIPLPIINLQEFHLIFISFNPSSLSFSPMLLRLQNN